MKTVKILSVIFALFFLDVCGMVPMPFRIGFEFQMGGELCKWAMENYTIQKSPIFEVGTRGEKLFHVELDGPDIEFVTVPFSHLPAEKIKLQECMDLITSAVKLMMELCTGPDNSTTVGEWYDKTSEIDGVWVRKCDLFTKIMEQSIKKPTCDWQAMWQPQATVQHPLRASINLLDDLFEETVVLLSTREAKPFYNPMRIEEKPLYDTALGGLIFLLAHEMCGINKSTVYQPHEVMALLMKGKYVIAGTPVSDMDMISDTLDSFETVHQFDAKRRTLFMSRRPFSAMLADILGGGTAFVSDKESKEGLSCGFLKAFRDAMLVNRFYRTREAHSEREQRIEVKDSFYRANYAEQFFDEEGKPLILTGLLDYFYEEARSLPALREVLTNGILSTAMFRCLNLERAVAAGVVTERAADVIKSMRAPSYYEDVLSSVARPVVRSFLSISNKEGIRVDALPAQGKVADLLSPPFPLDRNDAMGFFREGQYQQERFGGAIVEIRVIQHVKILRDERNVEPSGFLANPLYVKKEAETFYDWLSSRKIKTDCVQEEGKE